ncbi:hypothetical protein GGQ74_002214 [Desulfobaculum xiamenense]|uniref:DUF3450 domain-containing protein n=1 Tax=Desulfobaculum xiamenense TaxID=995050 RepID=A0A846QK75_9BACT|nr:DUF3450 domain-containing protein [Desulfobaculum xiamenense]NJB68541.1 hypothetical protein [Desulfobaculum xiamenense]
MTRQPLHSALLAGALCCLLATAPQAVRAADAPDATQAQRAVRSTVSVSAEAQRIANAWADERADLQARLRDLKAREAWLGFRRDKYRAYIANQRETIAELERRKDEFAKVRDQLEPFLDDTAKRLDAAIAADLPFLAEERAARMAFLRDSLDDYHLPLSEKLRRTLETLQVEAGYGRGAEATDTVLDIGGRRLQVTLLRLGRIGLYCRAADGSLCAMWDRASGEWTVIDDDGARSVRQGIEMAQRRRAADILALPMGGAR